MFILKSILIVLSILQAVLTASFPSLKAYLENSEFKTKVCIWGTGRLFEMDVSPNFFIDINPIVKPDLVMDITDVSRTGQLPENVFDIVVFEHLPSNLFIFNAGYKLKQIVKTLKIGGKLKFNIMWEREYADDIVVRIMRILPFRGLKDEYKNIVIKKAMELLGEDEEKMLQAEVFLALAGFCNPFYQIFTSRTTMMKSLSFPTVKFTDSSAFQKYKLKIARFFERFNMTVLEFDDQEYIWTLERIA